MNTALLPAPKLEDDCYDWWQRHEAVLACARKIDPEVVLVGDSITHFWGGEPVSPGAPRNGEDSFATTFGGARVLNLGFGWDRTQNVLWRFEHGELDGLRPRLAVVCIGTNNLAETPHARANAPEEIRDGVEKVCAELEARCPGVRVILMCLFPRGAEPTDPFRPRVAAVNASLLPMAARHGWRCIDIGSLLLELDGRLAPETAADGCHPTAAGYRVWGSVLRPLVAAALERAAPFC